MTGLLHWQEPYFWIQVKQLRKVSMKALYSLQNLLFLTDCKRQQDFQIGLLKKEKKIHFLILQPYIMVGGSHGSNDHLKQVSTSINSYKLGLIKYLPSKNNDIIYICV